jgi:hypothetical protein
VADLARRPCDNTEMDPSTQLGVVEINDQFCIHALVDQADETRVRVIAAKEDRSPENVKASLKTGEST